MNRLFPRTYTALLRAGHMPNAAVLILRDARRRDRIAMMTVRVAAQLQRPNQRVIASLLELCEASEPHQ